MRTTIRTAALVALVALSATAAFGQATGTMTAGANIVRGILVTNTQELAFGTIMAGTGGSVTIAPDGTFSTLGGVVPVASATSPAAFWVTDFEGRGNRKFTFTVLEASILLTGGGGADTMLLDTFTNDAIACQPCSRTPTTIHVGGTLTVGANQAPGTYVGTFTVRVNQQ